ncbi:glutathione-dependent disulfide-bond oxidoreductase [Vibrio splendidus]|uniref:Glutathione-dependent disulfide-bond oxidoreductase n=1 Tax=Vibrio splendidus TaxID=29497 RepID=A0A1C3J429_VIBSP|nr:MULTISPECIES: glutathione-dependent disulfide-bond oxidoreductase [Vibrio]MBT9241540.1 glutathione-dependent disulfide-bond oxidoreductase [Vibrio splendidus]MCC4881922.1 glutathione-dependent disulfide-bond oxidoreductase [Vibrio splendidus]MCT4350819.1 glutathione-dependent disulfide-bond oxidoreductase [Vibrio sp. NC2]MCW4444468.1 glutathione-dependent disulfide-bond oxidoreductase [Vibrio splendidus]MDH5902667.1 glutathione-dependent disulfide-bond oxidoreductase [Vibrio splendidus]
MSEQYTPPKVWVNDADGGNKWANINSPESGARFDKELPVGDHAFQLYSLGTPNGQKVTILLEELLAAGVKEAEYDAYLINIGEADQFSSGFVGVNPNSKIPALVDKSGDEDVNVFESASILMHLAEKFGHFLPKEGAARTQTLNWLFWAQGSAPFLGGGFGHFYAYADEKQEYPINRFAMEVKRQLDVLDKQLANNTYVAGEELSVADIAIWPWYGNLVLGKTYDAAEFLQVESYANVVRWAKQLEAREGFQRGRVVNRSFGEEWEQVPERHSAEDIDRVLKLRP